MSVYTADKYDETLSQNFLTSHGNAETLTSNASMKPKQLSYPPLRHSATPLPLACDTLLSIPSLCGYLFLSSMSSTVEAILRRIYRPPLDVTIYPADVHKHYKPWGFTLYRTCYTPESDRQWELLIDKISTAVLSTLSRYKDRGADPDDTAIVSEHFKLDARSDPATLDGLTMDELSEIYCNAVGGSPMEMRTSLVPDHRIFLWADEEVLQNLDSPVLKVVQAAPAEDADPEEYYQWMTVEADGGLIEFWTMLEICDSGLFDLIWEEQPGALWTDSSKHDTVHLDVINTVPGTFVESIFTVGPMFANYFLSLPEPAHVRASRHNDLLVQFNHFSKILPTCRLAAMHSRRKIEFLVVAMFVLCAWFFFYFNDYYEAFVEDSVAEKPWQLETEATEEPKVFYTPAQSSTVAEPSPSLPDRIVVMAKLPTDDTSWVHTNLPDWQSAIYDIDTETPHNTSTLDPLTNSTLRTLRNKGMEANAYLAYILQNYNNLPSTIAFIHPHKDGYPIAWHTDNNEHSNVISLQTLKIEFVQSNGYANIRCINDPGCPHEVMPFRNPPEEHRTIEAAMPDTWQDLFNNTDVPLILATPCCAQFAVSRKQVQKRPLDAYKKYYTWLMETPLKDETSGRVFEYLWHILFGQDPVYCPAYQKCYCDVYGKC
ncbi:hypothetical protein OPT61_g3635 [Boeremia exigua]|uniref:Uncharacterized protein n=1 Tax=Boeremia exigua TaxID=749465 RepID=A0ACC2IH44_9PLEO|nr:hypothetical protein OPT61_g3635 [Boeremia exigua]